MEIGKSEIKISFKDVPKYLSETHQKQIKAFQTLLDTNKTTTKDNCEVLKELFELNKPYYEKMFDYAFKTRDFVELEENKIKSGENVTFFRSLKYNRERNEMFLSVLEDFPLDKKININRGSPIGRVALTSQVTPLQYYAYYGAAEKVKECISTGKYKTDGVCKYAIAGGHKSVVDVLVEAGFSFDYCFGIANKFNRYELSDWLLNNYKCEQIPAKNLVEEFNDTTLCFILLNKISVNGNWGTVLEREIKCDNVEMIKFITNQGQPILRKFNISFINDLEAVKCLVEKARFGITDELIEEAEKNNKEIFNYLQEVIKPFKAIKNSEAIEEFPLKSLNAIYNNNTLLSYAIIKENLRVVKLLIEKYNQTSSGGIDILYRIIHKNNYELAEYLIKNQEYNANEIIIFNETDDEIKTSYKMPLFFYVFKKGLYDIFKYLVTEKNANLSLKCNITIHMPPINRYGGKEVEISKTLLCNAIENNRVEMIQFLIEKCHQNVNEVVFEQKYCGTETALIFAYNNDKFEILDMLIEKYKADTEELFHRAINDGNTKYMTKAFCDTYITKYDIDNVGAELPEEERNKASELLNELIGKLKDKDPSKLKYCNVDAPFNYIKEKIKEF